MSHSCDIKLSCVPRLTWCLPEDVANFKHYPIANSDKPDFHAFVRKLVVVEFMDRCSMYACGFS